MKKNILPIFVFFMSISNYSLANNLKASTIYSNFCGLVAEAMAQGSDAKSQHEYIVKHFDERVASKDLKDAYDVVFQVAPDKRYSVFKTSIEEDVGAKWECGSLREYFDQYMK